MDNIMYTNTVLKEVWIVYNNAHTIHVDIHYCVQRICYKMLANSRGKKLYELAMKQNASHASLPPAESESSTKKVKNWIDTLPVPGENHSCIY